MDDLPDPRDPIWTKHDAEPWPEWVVGFRPWQLDAVEEIVDHYERGADLVILDAPTGTGKTIIGEMVRRLMGGKTTYVCHSIRLQHQFCEDFGYARLVKGRRNYPTELGGPDITAADCTGKQCGWCEEMDSCPYRIAKAGALAANVAVANTSYWLHEVNGVKGGLAGRPGLIVDECDTLEGALMGWVEVRVPQSMQAKAKVQGLKKGAHRKTVVAWLGDVEVGLRRWANERRGAGDTKTRREVKDARRLAARCKKFAEELLEDAEEGEGSNWVRDYPTGRNKGTVVFKPVKVGGVGEQKVWSKVGEKGLGEQVEGVDRPWALAMSATVISADEWVESNGAGGLNVQVVRVDSPFPVENRPVKYLPLGDMKYKTWERDVEKVVQGVNRILDRHPQDAILVHATNYRVTEAVVAGIKGKRPVMTHRDARGRDDALARYVRSAESGHAPVIVSPSLDRGVDLPGDLCRVMVVAKMPFMSMGDRQVSERIHTPGGQSWYTANTARTLVQMTGRGVRSVDDHAVTYVLDSQFGRWLRDGKRVLPKWWMDGVQAENVKKFLSVE